LGDKFPLDLLLEAGQAYLAIRMKPGIARRIIGSLPGRPPVADKLLNLRIRLRYCELRYQENQVFIIANSKYRSGISKGKFDLLTTEKTQLHKGSRVGVSLDFNARLGPAETLPALGAHANAGLLRVRDQRREITETEVLDVHEVEQQPNGWRVGDHKRGDPRKLDQCLDGPYFQAPVPGYPHTCEAEFREGQQRGTLTFTVIVRRDGLFVDRVVTGIGHEEDSIQAVTAMRNKIAAIRLEQEPCLREIGRSTDEVEMVIAKVACEIVRAQDGEPTSGPSAPTELGVSAAPGAADASPVRRRRARLRPS